MVIMNKLGTVLWLVNTNGSICMFDNFMHFENVEIKCTANLLSVLTISSSKYKFVGSYNKLFCVEESQSINTDPEK